MLFGVLTPLELFEEIVSLIVAMVIHEFMHGFVAFKLGDDTAMEHGRLSFNPLKHIDPFMTIALPILSILIFHFPIMAAKPVPFNPARLKFDDYGAALVAAAGPVSNLLLAVLAAIVLHVLPVSTGIGDALSIFALVNVLLFVFNLVPIPPLDGSRVVYAFAPDAVRMLLDQVEPYGFLIIFALIYFNGFTVLQNIDQMVINLLNRI